MTATVLALLAARILTGTPTIAPHVVIEGQTMACIALTAREVRSHGRHVHLCVNGSSGEILGSVLTRRGVPVCTITGTIALDTGCFVMDACGVSTSGC